MKHAAQQQPVFTMQQEYTLCCDEGYGQMDGGFRMGPVPVPIKNAAGVFGVLCTVQHMIAIV